MFCTILFSGKITLWSIAKVFEAIRYTVLLKGFGHYDRLKDKNHSIFMASTSYHFTDVANNLTAFEFWSDTYPLYVRLNINYAGTSAFSFKISLCYHRTGVTLYTAYMTFVYVDYLTRKPCPFPDWYNEAKKLQMFESPQPRLALPNIPAGAFAYTTVSAFSDIDHNGHVNQSIYVKWCTDAGTVAALSGHYTGFSKNIGGYPFESMQLKYAKEGMVHETFITYTWQDVSNSLVLYFVVTKQNEPAVFAKLHFKSFKSKSLL